MGCDIHLYVEQRVNGIWKTVDTWSDKYNEGYLSVAYDDMAYRDRNYSLFAILADVRNGRGFAGVKTGDGFVPIGQPKGLPNDVSREVKGESERWASDGHSHSFFTVREILDYDWNQKTVLSGWVDAENFRRWKNWGSPESWCGMVRGSGIKHVTLQEMESAVDIADKSRNEESLIGLHTEVQWTKHYFQQAGSFCLSVFRALHKAQPEDVRFVFWFDN